MKIIKINNLYKTYDADTIPVHAINGINLTIEEGEFTAIVGPSGSGKTTLLNIIGGIDNASQGAVYIDGIDILNLSSHKLTNFRMKNIGFVFQAYNLIPVLTAIENVEFIMQLQGIQKTKRKKRATELLHAVGLENMLNRRPAKLSGGQQQRVAVARALASKPRFVLADEPTANLDSKSAENLLFIMQKLNQEEKTTFIFSTHDQRVMTKARRIVTLEDGKIKTDKYKKN